MPAYPGSPADRLAWDRDGSVVTITDTAGVMSVMGSASKRALNSETGDRALTYGYDNRIREIAVIFPMAVDLYAFFMAAPLSAGGGGNIHLWTVQVSKNTTNGRDGTWVSTLASSLNPFRQVSPDYRVPDNWNVVVDRPAAREIRGIRFLGSASSWNSGSFYYLNALHLYGTPSSSATQERVAFWHPSLDVRLPSDGFDWGDVPRGTSADKTFRIKNLSSALTATELEVYVEELNNIAPSLTGMHSFSVDGGATFQSRLTIPPLAPGATTAPIILRRVVPTNALISTWSARVVADVYSWIGA